MYKKNSILALIPARGGSKSIPKKNIKSLAGKPLIHWTIDAAYQSKYIDRLIVSTDDEEIAAEAERRACEVPFIRPSILAQDDTGSIEVILHALDTISDKYDFLLLLQPTSPFRTSDDIDAIIEFAIDNDVPAAVSVALAKKHPMYLYEILEGKLKPFIPGAKNQVRRQDMPPAYEHNGALYIASTDFLRNKQSFNSEEVYAFPRVGRINLDIDTLEDWNYAEYILTKGDFK